MQDTSSPHRPYLDHFFKLLTVCHSVVPDSDSSKPDKIKYQASSPDELALVEGAATIGYKFLNRTSGSVTVQVWNGEPEVWKTLIEFPFDSSRKRMSVIVENEGRYFIMTKGADSIMIPRCNLNEEEKNILQDHLNKFAREGKFF